MKITPFVSISEFRLKINPTKFSIFDELDSDFPPAIIKLNAWVVGLTSNHHQESELRFWIWPLKSNMLITE